LTVKYYKYIQLEKKRKTGRKKRAIPAEKNRKKGSSRH
jgi:hypothetical protein